MERTKPEYPGAHAEGFEAPMDPDASRVCRLLLESDGPVKFGPGSVHPLMQEMSRRFGYKSEIVVALYPRTGAPWAFGLHQCSYPRVWTQQEERLFQEIGRRLEDGLTSLLMYRKLSDGEEKFRTMMEAFAEPLHICSHDFIIEYLNPAMIRRAGRDATGEKCYTALHGLDSKCEWCVFDKVLKGDYFDINIVSPLDDRRYRVSNMPIKNKDGTISKMAIYRDITNYMKAVSEKEKAQAQLMQAQKMESIGNLAGGIAHDFNNILTAIIGYTELALDDVEKDSMIEDNLQEVYTAGKRAKELVAQILTFARQTEKELLPIQIDIIVKEVLRFIRSSIPTTIEVKKDIDSDSLIMGSQTEVHQIIMNLCTNAAHAMEDEGGILEVSLKDVEVDRNDSRKFDLNNGDYVELSVSDTGTGIPPDIVDSIFDPYFTTKSPGEGTGMGLAMVHGIVKSYGGKITVESTHGKGTNFTIYLPVTRKRKTQCNYKPEQLPTGTERILIIDDEAPIAKMDARNLEGLGYSVTIRTSSLEAMELFRAKPSEFDLVITDMTMPDLTGDKLAVELMKIRPDIPIILCTGYSKKISDETASEIGIKAFAYKPVVKADLAKTVRKVLERAKR
jgi:nitrogen-specific signal transduction histidine kinase/ActR/RegA family two-component response regulator